MRLTDEITFWQQAVEWGAKVSIGADAAALAPLSSDVVAQGWARLPPPRGELAPRALLQVASWPDATGTTTALVSEATVTAGGQSKLHLLLLARGREARRITGVFSVCTACVALGVDGLGGRCVECDGWGWDPWFGEGLTALGAGATVSRLAPAHRIYAAACRRAPLMARPGR